MPVAPEYLHLVYPDTVFKALLYGRASRDPKKKGRSVADQIGEGRDLCDEHGWPIAEVFDQDIDRSASRYAKRRRADFEALIEAIERGDGTIVVAWEASRYYRDIEAYIRLRNACWQHNVLLCYNGAVYDLSKAEDRKATARDALDAESEADGIQARNLRTTRQQAKKGAPHGRIAWGYGRRYDPDTGDLVEQYVLPDRGPMVVELFQRFEGGESRNSILVDFQSRGDRTPGSPWRAHHLNSMLRNATYIGKRIYQGQAFTDGTWPPISNGVDDEGFIKTFYAVQKILDDSGPVTRDWSVRHLQVYIAICGECPNTVPLKSAKSRGHPTYQCESLPHTTIRTVLMNAYVEEAVIGWLSKPEAADAFRTDEQEKKAAAARARLAYLNGQLEEARASAGRMKTDGTPELSIASLASLEESLTPQIEAARAEAEVSSAPPVVRMMAGRADAGEIWEGLTLEKQRTVLRHTVTVRLFKARVQGVRSIEPGRITLSFVGQPGFVPPKGRNQRRQPSPKTVAE